ncbi:Anaphase-promoting complex subunit 5 [Blyttiomyces sp. JEL0837]|nr:Anaphase-promoting complex subunit 5 [Blyttiomyces sp. JEL0837]
MKSTETEANKTLLNSLIKQSQDMGFLVLKGYGDLSKVDLLLGMEDSGKEIFQCLFEVGAMSHHMKHSDLRISQELLSAETWKRTGMDANLGNYAEAFERIREAKSLAPMFYFHESKAWIRTGLLISFQRALNRGQLKYAHHILTQLKEASESKLEWKLESEYQHSLLLIRLESVGEAFEKFVCHLHEARTSTIGNRLYSLKFALQLADFFLAAESPTSALPYIFFSLTHAERSNIHEYSRAATIRLSRAMIQLSLPLRALETVRAVMPPISVHGDRRLKGDAEFCMAQCILACIVALRSNFNNDVGTGVPVTVESGHSYSIFAMGVSSSDGGNMNLKQGDDQKRILACYVDDLEDLEIDIDRAVYHADQAYNHYSVLDAVFDQRDVAYFRARLLDSAGRMSARNAAAEQFLKLNSILCDRFNCFSETS